VYSLEGGKCIRGYIVKTIMETFNSDIFWEPIVAVELLQAATLIIDDLPSMDNDRYRRNKLSTFVVFGENETILTGFYMVSESLRLMNSKLMSINDISKLKKTIDILISEWTRLCGKELVIGQLMDLKINIEELLNIKLDLENNFNEQLMKYKTCSLFSFCFILGAIFSNITDDINNNIEDFKNMGLYFGIMYQLTDDYKDRDEDNNFNNYIKVLGEKIINKKTEKEIFLTNLEKKILIMLIDKVKIEKNFLLEVVLNIKKETETKTLESHLTRIRSKLLKINSNLKILSKENKVFLTT